MARYRNWYWSCKTTRGQCVRRVAEATPPPSSSDAPAAPATGTHNVTEDSRPRLIGQSGCLEDVQGALGLELANQGRQRAEGSGRGPAHPVEGAGPTE